MKPIVLVLLLLPLVAAANETPTNAFRHVAMPARGGDTGFPITTGLVTNDAARKAATIAAVRTDAPRNWYLSRLAATNPPVTALVDPALADVLVLPLGEYAVDRGNPALAEILMVDEGVCRGVVQRYRRGVVAPTNLPIRVAHAGPAVGRVEDLYFVLGDGVWARIAVEASVAATNTWRVSPELHCFRQTAADELGAWGALIVPRHLTGLALTTEPAIPALQRTEVIFGIPSAGPYPARHLTRNNP